MRKIQILCTRHVTVLNLRQHVCLIKKTNTLYSKDSATQTAKPTVCQRTKSTSNELMLLRLGLTARAVPWLRRLAAGFPPRRPGFDPGSVHVGFMVDRFFPEFFGFPLSISFHRCSITRKRTKSNNHLHHRVAQ
jgi:hypothetical protein